MGETVGHIKKVLGNVTEDREVEAEGRAEESTGDKPDSETVDKVEDEVQQARGEKEPRHGAPPAGTGDGEPADAAPAAVT